VCFSGTPFPAHAVLAPETLSTVARAATPPSRPSLRRARGVPAVFFLVAGRPGAVLKFSLAFENSVRGGAAWRRLLAEPGGGCWCRWCWARPTCSLVRALPGLLPPAQGEPKPLFPFAHRPLRTVPFLSLPLGRGMRPLCPLTADGISVLMCRSFPSVSPLALSPGSLHPVPSPGPLPPPPPPLFPRPGGRACSSGLDAAVAGNETLHREGPALEERCSRPLRPLSWPCWTCRPCTPPAASALHLPTSGRWKRRRSSSRSDPVPTPPPTSQASTARHQKIQVYQLTASSSTSTSASISTSHKRVSQNLGHPAAARRSEGRSLRRGGLGLG